jgi:hypothetical protein
MELMIEQARIVIQLHQHVLSYPFHSNIFTDGIFSTETHIQGIPYSQFLSHHSNHTNNIIYLLFTGLPSSAIFASQSISLNHNNTNEGQRNCLRREGITRNIVIVI